MLVYAKERKNIDTPETAFRQKKTGLDKIYSKFEQLKAKFGTNYSAISDGMKEFYNSLPENDPAYPHRLYCLVDERGLYQSDNSAAPDKPETRSHRPLIHPVTKKPTAVPAMGWRFTDKTLDELLEKGYIHFGEDETKVPRVKRYLREYEYEIPATVFYKPGAAASSELQKIFGKKIFDNPKDRGEIKRIIGFLANNDDIILDFFSGSATTAHAVMQLNAEDGGHRKFIMVQLPEETAEDSEARKAGYKNICEIGKERIRRAGAKIKSETGADIDYGFRVLKLDETNMEDVYYSPAETTQAMLAGFESNIKSDRNALDLLYGCLLDWGLPLSMSYSSEKIDGVTVHTYRNKDGALIDLIACFDKAIPESVIKTIAKRQPLRVVFRDDSFADSPSKINVSEIFKMISPDTRVKVI